MTTEYKGVSLDQYHAAMVQLSKRMFVMFDSTGNKYNNRRGDSIMWQLSWIASCVAREAVDYHIDTGDTLENSILAMLYDNKKEDCYTRQDIAALAA